MGMGMGCVPYTHGLLMQIPNSDEDDMDESPVKRPRTAVIPDPVTPLPTVTWKLAAVQKKKAEQEKVPTKAAERLGKEKAKMSKVQKAAKLFRFLWREWKGKGKGRSKGSKGGSKDS